jgi:hypothetical protein
MPPISLAAAYGILRQSGGHIRIDSAVDRGTVVDLFLSRTSDLQPDIMGAVQAGVPICRGLLPAVAAPHL